MSEQNIASPINWTTQQRKVRDLLPMPENPRQMTAEQARDLQKSIEKFGLVEIPAIDADGILIAGHQRMKIMLALGRGDETIDVRVPDRKLTDDERKEYNLRSNKNTGEWDDDKLAQYFDEAMLADVGFSEDEIAKALGKAMTGEDDGFDGEPPIVAKTQLGDLYQLGDHRLLCGDATKRVDLEKLMGSDRAAMVFTDPPYNTAYEGGMNIHGQDNRDGILNDKMTTGDFYTFLHGACNNMIAGCDGAIYICMSSTEFPTLRRAFDEAGGHFQSMIVWVKNTFTLSRSDWQNQHEPILYGWPSRVVNHFFAGFRDEGNTWKFEPTDAELLAWAKTRIEKTGTDIWCEKKPSKSPEHPTMKPIPLVVKAILASSRPDEIVLDLFGGSGSTLMASDQTGRRCRMMELDPKYCDVIIERYEMLTGNKAVKI